MYLIPQAWTSVAKTKLCDVNLKELYSNQPFNLLSAGVPRSANEVLIYVTLATGNNVTGSNSDIEVALWTTDGKVEYKKYLFGRMYAQESWSYNSENMFFPVTPDHLNLNVQYNGTKPVEKGWCTVFVIGYRE